MGTTTINGVPAHPLWVHAVVVLVPLSALALVVCAAWPAAMRRAGVVLPLLALVGMASVPLATDAGEWLQERVPETAAVERHTEMGDELLPWSVAIFVLALALWLLHRGALSRFLPSGPDAGAGSGGVSGPGAPSVSGRASASAGGPASSRVILVVGTVLALTVGAGAVVEVYRIGDSGAKAVWHGF
ncbi:DUF2231 domain-containing protein [Streptomyces sp. IBSBF 2806]|uniref:DUF2231 domain-containing protein n=1 Tax=Streptomyces sp. IBSBF 2806 TaxID=2903529 RepID=UPI002FDBEDA4